MPSGQKGWGCACGRAVNVKHPPSPRTAAGYREPGGRLLVFIILVQCSLFGAPFQFAYTRGGVRMKGGSCLAAGAGGQPPHGYTSSTACASLPAAALTAVALGWPNRRKASTCTLPPGLRQPPQSSSSAQLARSSPINSLPATGPAMPAVHPSWWF